MDVDATVYCMSACGSFVGGCGVASSYALAWFWVVCVLCLCVICLEVNHAEFFACGLRVCASVVGMLVSMGGSVCALCPSFSALGC